MKKEIEIISVEENLLRRGSLVRRQSTNNSLKGPLRAFRLCLLSVILPGALIAGPLYIRYHLYSGQIYPLAMSDMRLIDNKVSTTWCQKQHVKVNTTFNAFLLAETPTLIREPRILTMTRQLKLWDDMKEYWGFYLLKGSIVTVSTCSRWPGSSLTIIRGHKNLHECAYIGDDSSEELDELLESIRESNTNADSIAKQNDGSQITPAVKDISAPINNPHTMKRHRADVKFHDPNHPIKTNINHTLHAQIADVDDHDLIDKKQMVKLLEQLLIQKELKTRRSKDRQLSDDHMHKHRNQSVNENEKINLKFANNAEQREHHNETTQGVVVVTPITNDDNNANDDNINNQTQTDKNTMTSEEIFQKTLQLIEARGTNGRKILQRLIDKYNLHNDTNDSLEMKDTYDLKQIIDNAVVNRTASISLNTTIENATTIIDYNRNETRQNSTNDTNTNDESKLLRQRRQLILSLADHLNEQDNEEKNVAIEEGFVADGIADHHEIVNETTLNDRSNSEFWSSFSSSEETLLNCAGLILNLPLTPHMKCEESRPDHEALGAASLPNTVTYTVPTNGYYFFIFNSENEVQENYLRIQFDIHKTVYDVSNSIQKCFNSTRECSLNLKFFSNEKLVLELPVSNNDSMWNQEFIVVSECEPRTVLYVICVIAAPLVILLFAFQ